MDRRMARLTGLGYYAALEHRHLEDGEAEGQGGIVSRFRGILLMRTNTAIELAACLKEDSQAWEVFDARYNLNFNLASTRALFLYELLNGDLTDEWLEEEIDSWNQTRDDLITDTRQRLQAELAALAQAVAAGGVQVPVSDASLCKIMPRQWQLQKRWLKTVAARALFETAQHRASATTKKDFLDNDKMADVLHHQHYYPCAPRFLTSTKFNMAESGVGAADYETCRRIIEYHDRSDPWPAPNAFAQMARNVVVQNLPVIKWMVEEGGMTVTATDCRNAGITLNQYNAAGLPYDRGLQKPTPQQWSQVCDIPAINQTTYEGVVSVMAFLWPFKVNGTARANVFNHWLVRNGQISGPESYNTRFERVEKVLIEGGLARVIGPVGGLVMGLTQAATGLPELSAYLDAVHFDYRTDAERAAKKAIQKRRDLGPIIAADDVAMRDVEDDEEDDAKAATQLVDEDDDE